MPSPIILRNLRKSAIKAQIPYSTLGIGLTHYFTMDEVAGTRVDSVGNADMALEGGPVGSVAGIHGNAAHVLGGDGLINSGGITETGNFSISTWVNNPGTVNWCIAKESSGIFTFLGSAVAPGDITVADMAGMSYAVATDPGLIIDNVWNHVVLLYDPTGATNLDILKVYINGIYYPWTTDLAGLIPNNLTLGPIFKMLSGGNEFSQDEVGIWNKILTPVEIVDLNQNKFYPF